MGNFRGEEVGAGGEEVELSNESVAYGAGGNDGGPAGDERDAVTAFVEIGFIAAIAGARPFRCGGRYIR